MSPTEVKIKKQQKNQFMKMAIEYYEKAANLKEPCAMVKMGNLLENGVDDVLEQDLDKSLVYYKMAAEAKDTRGIVGLGFF